MKIRTQKRWMARGVLVVGVLVPMLLVWLTGCWLFNRPPVAGFTVGPSTAGTAPFTVTLSAAPSSDPDGEIESYSWSFGDGSQGTGRNVSHTYTVAGTFTIILEVADQYDEKDQAAKTIYVSPAAAAGPTASFTATPNSGTMPLGVTFDASATTYADGVISTYDWTFGDGYSGFGKTTSHTYYGTGTFTATLTVRGTDGKTGTATKTVSVYASGGGGTPAGGAPSARFDILFEDPAVVGDAYTNKTVAPVRVWLDPGDSEAATGRTIASYSWSFGDGAAATSISPTVQVRTYVTNLASKTFSVTLVVIDDVGAINSITKTVKVENYQPVAGFEIYNKLGTLAVGDWWKDEEDGLDDGRLTFTSVPPGVQTVSIRAQKIVSVAWLEKALGDPTPTTKSAKPTEFNDDDGPNMCFDPEGQTWVTPGTPPAWYPNRAWGIQKLKISWGDYSPVEYHDFLDAADTIASHPYAFGGGVQSWTITVTAIDYLGNEKSFSRIITMNQGTG